MSKHFVLTLLLVTAANAHSSTDDFLKTGKLHKNGFGEVLLGMTIDEASTKTGIEFKSSYPPGAECGSYILGKGGTFHIGKVRFLTTYNVIRRIDIWDAGVATAFNLRLMSRYVPLDKNLYKSMSQSPSHYIGGSDSYYFKLNGSDSVLRIGVNGKGIVDGIGLGLEPEIKYTEGCG